MRCATWVVLLATLLGAGCAPGEGPTVRVALTTSTIATEPVQVPTGIVKLRVENMTQIAHSIVLLRTDLRYDRLPTDAAELATIVKSGLVRATGPMAPREVRELGVQLGPGSYVLMCAVPAHYDLGMRAPLIVR